MKIDTGMEEKLISFKPVILWIEARAEYSSYFIQKYGNWLLTKNLVIRINDIVFVHGGINEEFSKWKMKNINSRVQKEIQAIQSGKRMTIKIVYQADAPQWFRGLILNEEDVFSDDVDRILNNLKAKYMVVGHTVRQKDILNSKKLDRFQGRIWGQLDVDYKEIERYLATAKIISVTPDENAGRTEPWIILLDDGRIKRRGYFKHVSRCRPNPLPDCYKYEIAAYQLSMLLDIKCVPPTVERKIKGISGSLQLWVGDSEKLKNVLEKNIKLFRDLKWSGLLKNFTRI